MVLLAGFQGVFNQAGHCHGAYATGNRGDEAGTLGSGLVGHITDQTAIGQTVDTDIDDDGAGLDPFTGNKLGLADGDRVQVKIDGPKPGVMGGVLIRANDKCALDFHIDTDDGNAFLLKQGQLVTVLGKEE